MHTITTQIICLYLLIIHRRNIMHTEMYFEFVLQLKYNSIIVNYGILPCLVLEYHFNHELNR